MAKRERFNRALKGTSKRGKMIRQMMTSHDARLPTLEELRATVEGIDDQCMSGTFGESFGFDIRTCDGE
jgi:hypothetical protein